MRDIFKPVHIMGSRPIAQNSIKPRSTESSVAFFKGLIRAETPRIPRMLKILEPRIFPMAMSFFFWIAATTDVANSGREVPTATTVNPMTASERCSRWAKYMALHKKTLAPRIKRANPNYINAIENHNDFLLFSSASLWESDPADSSAMLEF